MGGMGEVGRGRGEEGEGGEGGGGCGGCGGCVGWGGRTVFADGEGGFVGVVVDMILKFHIFPSQIRRRHLTEPKDKLWNQCGSCD